jgi:hypothetical protein
MATLDQLISQIQQEQGIEELKDIQSADAYLQALKRAEKEELDDLRTIEGLKQALIAEWGEDNLEYNDVLKMWVPKPMKDHDTSHYPIRAMEELKHEIETGYTLEKLKMDGNLIEYEKKQTEYDKIKNDLSLQLDGLSDEFKSAHIQDISASFDYSTMEEADLDLQNKVEEFDKAIEVLNNIQGELTKQQKHFIQQASSASELDYDLQSHEFEKLVTKYKKDSDKYIYNKDTEEWTRIDDYEIDEEGFQNAYTEYLLKRDPFDAERKREAAILKYSQKADAQVAKLQSITTGTTDEPFDASILGGDEAFQSDVISVINLGSADLVFQAIAADPSGKIGEAIRGLNKVWYKFAEENNAKAMEVANEKYLGDPNIKAKKLSVFEDAIHEFETTDDNLNLAFEMYKQEIPNMTSQDDYNTYLKVLEDHWKVEDLGSQFQDYMMPKKESIKDVLGLKIGLSYTYPDVYINFSDNGKFDVNKAWDYLSNYSISKKEAGNIWGEWTSRISGKSYHLEKGPENLRSFQHFRDDLPERVGLVSPQKKSVGVDIFAPVKFNRPNFNLATALTSKGSASDRTAFGTPIANNEYYEAYYDTFRDLAAEVHETSIGDVEGMLKEYRGVFGLSSTSMLQSTKNYPDGYLVDFVTGNKSFAPYIDEITKGAEAAGEKAQKLWMETALNDPKHKDHATVVRALNAAYESSIDESDSRHMDYEDNFEENSGYFNLKTYK